MSLKCNTTSTFHRDDLIAYYTSLGEEAMHRERVALWKVRRAQLGASREKFLKSQEDRWRIEMQEATEGKVRHAF